MNLREETYDYDKFKKEGTGSHEDFENYKTIIYPFDKYLITIQVTPNNEFIGITEIKMNKDFLSYKQKTSIKGYHDVEKYYPE